LSFYKNKRVLVTGGDGFIGSHLVDKLLNEGAIVRVSSRKESPKFLKHVVDDIEFIKANLLNPNDVDKVCYNQEIVFHLASIVAGVGYNSQHNASMMTANSIMNMLILEGARKCNVGKYQFVSSTCIYPDEASIPTLEEEGMIGNPAKSNLGYGWSKRASEIQAKMYSNDFDINISIIRPMNIYGSRDDASEQISHVIPAMIRKVLLANDSITVWGSGKQSRTFVYVKDMIRGMMMALEKYPVPDPINIGTSEEVTMVDLISKIKRIAGRPDLKVIFDTSKPEGQIRKAADTSKAERLIGFKSHYSLDEGLKETIEWYKQNKEFFQEEKKLISQ